jgi:hypothetical protein
MLLRLRTRLPLAGDGLRKSRVLERAKIAQRSARISVHTYWRDALEGLASSVVETRDVERQESSVSIFQPRLA